MKDLKAIFNINTPEKAAKLSFNAMDMHIMGATDGDNANGSSLIESTLERIRDEVSGLGLDLKSSFLNAGSISLIFRPEGVKHSIVRLGFDDKAAESAIALKSFGVREYPVHDKNISDDPIHYQIHLVLYAPDLQPPGAVPAAPAQVEMQDIFNTLRVLKAEGLARGRKEGEGLEYRIRDMEAYPQGHFAYLKGQDGNYLRYPKDTPDVAMRGRPIAFIRDLNCLPENEKGAAAFGSVDKFLEKIGKKREDILPAPMDCVTACHQQNTLLTFAKAELVAKGIDMQQFAEAAAAPATPVTQKSQTQQGAGATSRNAQQR